MAILPDRTNTTEYHIESKMVSRRKPRNYLGMSSIGTECLRAQWYSWRWYTIKKFTARTDRIFTRGHLEESSIIQDLKSIGCFVFRKDGEKEIELTGAVGEEQEEIIGYQRHSKGHPDGRIRGVIEAPKTAHLLELKTMKDAKFKELKEKGLKKGFLGYFGQAQKYMGRLHLTRTLFIATNKDTQARVYMRVKFDKKYYLMLKEREKNIILSGSPPTKKYSADHYLCRWCDHKMVCHYEENPVVNCRSCQYVDVLEKGKWGCGILGKNLSTAAQRRACNQYKILG